MTQPEGLRGQDGHRWSGVPLASEDVENDVGGVNALLEGLATSSFDGRQTVGEFLTNLKLPRLQRELVKCICDDLGVVCVAPLRIDERVKVTGATTRILRLELSSQGG